MRQKEAMKTGALWLCQAATFLKAFVENALI
jgi:hypothetical protein